MQLGRSIRRNLSNMIVFSKNMTFITMTLFCLIIHITGCTVIDMKTSELRRSNNEFISRNQRLLYFEEDSSVKADYLGKHDGTYIYKALDSKGQSVFFHLPSANGKKVLITLNKPSHQEKSDKTAIIDLYKHNNNFFLEQVSTDGTRTNSTEYPIIIYANDLDNIRYSCKDGNFKNDSEIHTGLSVFDSTVLGIRNTGYIITVPLDAFATTMFSPYFWVLGPCGGNIWGCER